MKALEEAYYHLFSSKAWAGNVVLQANQKGTEVSDWSFENYKRKYEEI